jgi:hypothetical protein
MFSHGNAYSGQFNTRPLVYWLLAFTYDIVFCFVIAIEHFQISVALFLTHL